MLNNFKKKYIGDKAFYKRYILIALPMIIQNFITNFVSFLDNIMVGQLGTEQMTGVAIINQLHFVYALAIFGVAGAATIFGAQFYGKRDLKGHMYTFRFRLYMIALVSILAALIFIFGGDTLVSMYLTAESGEGDAALTLGYAKEYLSVILIGLIPFALTQAYASIIKETGQTFIPMLAGLCGVVINAILDYAFIFGLGPIPAMGVTGAAIATVIARFIECAIVLIWAHSHTEENAFLVDAYKGVSLPMDLFKKIMGKGAPLILNEILWASGMTALTQAYSIRGLEIVAAINIANTINNLFNIVFIQLGACISIIVGQYLGAGELDEAKDADNKMIFFSVACCTVMAILMFALGKYFPHLYNTSDHIREIATSFIYVQAIMMPFFSFSHCSYFTLRSGGKTIITFIFDSGFTWVIMVPVALALSMFSPFSIVMVYYLTNATEYIKNIMGFLMVKSNVWLKQLV